MSNKFLKISSFVCAAIIMLGSIITTVFLANNISWTKTENENNEEIFQIENKNKEYPLAKSNNMYYWANIHQYINNRNDILKLIDSNSFYNKETGLIFKTINSDNLSTIIKNAILKHSFFAKFPKKLFYTFSYLLSENRKVININLEIDINKKIKNKKIIYFDQFQINIF